MLTCLAYLLKGAVHECELPHSCHPRTLLNTDVCGIWQVLCESLLWVGKTVEEFGLGALNVKYLIEWLKVSARPADW